MLGWWYRVAEEEERWKLTQWDHNLMDFGVVVVVALMVALVVFG